MKRLHLLPLLLLSLATAGPVPAGTGVTVSHAWVAEAPPGVGVNAGYLSVRNHGDRERVLRKVTSPDFARVEMHRTITAADGTTTMERQQDIVIPAGASLDFSPGGYHLMLFEKREPVRSGARVGLTLHFADGTLLETSVPVRRMDGHRDHR